jgi:hypothetical protein
MVFGDGRMMSRFPLTVVLALCGCASYRVLPSPPPPAGLSPLPMRYQTTRLWVFRSVKEDGAVERVFVDPHDSMRVVVTLLRPEVAAYASSDGGASWTRASIPLDVPDSDERTQAAVVPPRLLAEVLFDARDARRAWARAHGRVFHTEDGGLTWAATPLAGIVALAQGVDGLLWAAGEGGLHVSDDGGRSWVHRPVHLPGASADTRLRVRSLVLDQRGGRILLGVRDARSDSGPVAISTVLDGTSDAAQAALALVDATDAPPRALTAFGQGLTGVIETRDGGVSWRRTGLALDTWLASADGALYAVAADPMIEAAFLVRAHPELATALAQQLHGLHFDAASLRPAFLFPGRDRLLAGPLAAAPVFRSADGGATWVRVLSLEPALAASLRTIVDAQISAWEESSPQARGGERPAEHRAGTGENPTGPGRRGNRGGRPGRRGAAPEAIRTAPRAPSVEAFQAYLDPLRLLARFNSGLALTGMARAGAEFYAWAPTATHWDRLADAALAACEGEGEISLGPGATPAGPGAFTLLRSTDGGASWAEVAQGPDAFDGAERLRVRQSAPYPSWLAAGPREAFIGLTARDHSGPPWHETWRDSF